LENVESVAARSPGGTVAGSYQAIPQLERRRGGIRRRQRRLDSSHREWKRRVQSHRAAGHHQTQSPNMSVLRSDEHVAKTSAPTTQLTLDTPRASAGAAEAAPSENLRKLPDCDVNDSLASAAPGLSAHAHISPVIFIRAQCCGQQELLCARLQMMTHKYFLKRRARLVSRKESRPQMI